MQTIRKEYNNKVRSLSVLSKDASGVTIMILVSVGSRYETEQERGLAHFVEHTIFKGTQKRPSSKQIGMEIESLGGSSNAFTAYEYTGYYIKAPAENFRASFEILADMFQDSVYAEEEINKERGVITEEIRMYEDRPTSKVIQIWNANLYNGSTLGYDIVGTEESVANMQRQQFLDFIQKHYYAENIMVVVAGNVQQVEVEKAVTELLGGVKPLDNPDRASKYTNFSVNLAAPADAKTRKRQNILVKDVNQSHLALGGFSLELNHPDRFALQVANALLGSGFGSRLFQVIRDELGLAYYVYSRLSAFVDVGNFTIGMGVTQGKEQDAVSAVINELTNIVQGKFTQDEFVRAKNFLIGNLVTEMETPEDLASYYGMQELLGMEKLSIEEVKTKVNAVTLADINRVVSDIYTPENYYLAAVTNRDLSIQF